MRERDVRNIIDARLKELGFPLEYLEAEAARVQDEIAGILSEHPELPFEDEPASEAADEAEGAE